MITQTRVMHRRRFLHNGIQIGWLPILPNLATYALPSSTSAVKSVITVFLAGGLSQLDSLDPKPNSPSSVRGEFKAIQSAIPGVHFTEYLPQLTQSATDLAVIRGVSHSIGLHDAGEKYMLTGVKAFRPDTPSLGAIASRWADRRTEVPAYAAIPSLGPNAGELGQLNESFNVFGDSGRLLKHGPDLDSPDQISQFEWRIRLLDVINSGRPDLESDKNVVGREEAYQVAQRALMAPRLRSLTDLEQESPATRDAYGAGEVGEYLLVARRLVEAGVRYVNVRLGGWDTHSDNFGRLRQLLPPVDTGLSALIQDLKVRGLLSSTLIALVTEFGRTSEINPGTGRDHWPRSYSVLLAGGRIRGGQVFGETDSRAAETVDSRCTPEDLAITVLQELGIVATETFVPPTGRVLLSEGRFLHELF